MVSFFFLFNDFSPYFTTLLSCLTYPPRLVPPIGNARKPLFSSSVSIRSPFRRTDAGRRRGTNR